MGEASVDTTFLRVLKGNRKFYRGVDLSFFSSPAEPSAVVK